MYTDEQIEQMFGKYIKNEYYFKTYVNIYRYFMENETDCDKFNHHHFYPSFLRKIENQDNVLKNRYHTIEKLDKEYDIKDNVVKLPIRWHVISHYCLGMTLQTTDAINSFFTLVDDYSKPIEEYTFNDVQTLAQLVEENALPNTIDCYVTQSERKEMYKVQQKEYKEKWKEEHKEEIEERKRKQREYAKQKRQEYKNYLNKR